MAMADNPQSMRIGLSQYILPIISDVFGNLSFIRSICPLTHLDLVLA